MNPSPRTALRVFIPFALGYFLSYLFRVVNAVIAPDLVQDLGIDPSQLGLLTSTYFIAFASSQLPLGLLLDRFGPRIVESILLVFAAVGAVMFAWSTSLTGVIVGRALIGFGVSACLMAAFKSYVLWFPRNLWPRVNGFQMAAGGLGALSATIPVEWTLGMTDWRGLFLGLGALTLAIALTVFFVVPEKTAQGPRESFGSQLRGVRQVFTSWDFWRTAPLTTLSQATFLSVQGLWAGPWLRDMAGMDRMGAAQVLSWIAGAMIVGFIVLGFAAERLSRAGVTVLTTAVTGMGVFMGVQALIILNGQVWAVPLWIGFGFSGTSGIIAYAAMSQSFPVRLSGRVTTGINLLVFIAAFAGQWAIGSIINLWPVTAQGHYHPSGYQAGFSLVLGLQALTLVWFILAGLRKHPVVTPDTGDTGA
ncbi:MAG: MFS transporter [Pseudomonadota bacterium]